jgi:hypothetical protein
MHVLPDADGIVVTFGDGYEQGLVTFEAAHAKVAPLLLALQILSKASAAERQGS